MPEDAAAVAATAPSPLVWPSPEPSAALLQALPPPPKDNVLTAAQWKTLLALCEPTFPALTPSTAAQAEKHKQAVATIQAYAPAGTSKAAIDAYLAESAIELPRFRESLRRVLAKGIPRQQLNDLKLVLNTLNSTAGSLLLTGHATPVAQLPLEARCLIIANWSSSYLATLRHLYRTFSGLVKKVWASSSPTIAPLLGYNPTPEYVERERADSYPFNFIDLSAPSSGNAALSADVVIVGSGCGAGVAASNLARAGLKVLVLEKSYHFSASLFPMPVAEGSEHLFESGGTLTSEDGSTVVVAGSNFGGGGTVNWSASLQPQAHVRNEWIQKHGLTELGSLEFQNSLDYVCERMGVAKATDAAALSKIPHNFANRRLLEGARQLGLSSLIVPQNTKGQQHWCGSCCYGCSSCVKQGPANNWLPDAASHGAHFLEGCFVDKILWSAKDRSRATGVLCTWTSRDATVTKSVTINASRVIVSSGTLHSPLVLQRSGLTNRHIGKNLHLHPCSAIFTTWPERSNPWEGPILTTAVTSLTTLDALVPGAHGPVIECVCATPAFATLFRPFRPSLTTKDDPLGAARDFKEQTAKWSHSSGFIVIQRDRDSGSIAPDPDNPAQVRLHYHPSHRDRIGLSAGQVLAARIAYVQGAEIIDCLVPDIMPFVRTKTLAGSGLPLAASPEQEQQGLKEINDRAFEAWLKQVQVKGLGAKHFESSPVGSAHQMGTCRIGKDRDSGAVDVHGKVWGTKNVWVADASVFPTASGVNPMVTTMAFAHWISNAILRETAATHGSSKL